MVKESRVGNWTVCLWSGAVSLVLYLAGVCLLALLMVNGLLPGQTEWGSLVGLGFVSAVVGGLTAARRSAFATLPSAALSTGVFLLAVILVGIAVWPESFWGDRSIMLALAVLLGGIFAGIWGAGGTSRRKKRRSRIGMK